MKILSASKKLIALVSGLLILGGATTVRAQFPGTTTRQSFAPFGLAGITAGQTARLNVFLPPGPVLPARTLNVELKFVDSSNHPVLNVDGQPQQTTVTLAPGESNFFELTGQQALSPGLTRAQIRPVVTVLPTGPLVPPNPCISTLEVIEQATSRTTFLYYPPSPILVQ